MVCKRQKTVISANRQLSAQFVKGKQLYGINIMTCVAGILMTQLPCVRSCLCYLVFVELSAVLSAKFLLKMFFMSVSINHFARNCKAHLLDFWIKVGDHIPEHSFF